jgi:hypothetical protein
VCFAMSVLMSFGSDSESELYYDRRSVGQSVLVSGAYDQIFIIVRLLRVC